jgi:uncharacterized membrane protein
MKPVNFILINALLCSFTFCHTQSLKNIKDTEFQAFLTKFTDVKPPLNYKKLKHKIGDMTKEEAVLFLQKKESELYYNKIDFDFETERVSYTKQENLPGYDFKY